jgi:hypothetical protein
MEKNMLNEIAKMRKMMGLNEGTNVSGVYYDTTIMHELKSVVGNLHKIAPYVLEIGDRVYGNINDSISVYEGSKLVKQFNSIEAFLRGIKYGAQKIENESTNGEMGYNTNFVGEESLNENLLELKQMSKQLYSFLKTKGFAVEITNKFVTPNLTTTKTGVQSSKNEEHIQIVVQEGNDGEMVNVIVTPSIVARLLVGGGDDWTYKAGTKFGNEWGGWQKNPEIIKYVDGLVNELWNEIKSKYPNMVYVFDQGNFYYVLHFGYGLTSKGGQLDLTQRKNNPNPTTLGEDLSDKTGDLYMEINDLIDEKYKDINYEDVAKVLENILKGIKAQSYREKNKIGSVTHDDVRKNFGLEEDDSLEMMGDDDNTVRISLAVMSKLSDIQLENPELRDKVNSIKALVMKMKDKTEIPTSEIG